LETNTGTEASSFASVAQISSGSATAASSTSSASVSGATINTGAVVGGIAGSLAVLAILGFLVAFFLRRRNRKKRAARFEAAQFRRSAMVLDDDGADEFPAVPRPPEMVQNRENNYTSSVTSTSSPGMAGAGAFRFQQENNNKTSLENAQEYYRDNVGQQYYDQGTPVGSAVPMQRAPLQPREQYTFGQVPTAGTTRAAVENANPFMVDDYDGEAHGAYGSAVGQYDNQAYDNYAYSPQTVHNAGAHALTHYTNKSMDESDAYGGI
jgi:hypothetical protein